MATCSLCDLDVCTHHYIRVKTWIASENPDNPEERGYVPVDDVEHLFFGFFYPGHSCKNPLSGFSGCPIPGLQCIGHSLADIEQAIYEKMPPGSGGLAVRMLYNPPKTVEVILRPDELDRALGALPANIDVRAVRSQILTAIDAKEGIDVGRSITGALVGLGIRGFLAVNMNVVHHGLWALTGQEV